MILCRLRANAHVIVSGLLLTAGLALANEPVTRSQMHSFVYETIGAAAILVIGAFWVLLTTINSKAERAVLAIVTRLEASLERTVAALEHHNEDAMAHGAVTERTHPPMLEKLDRIGGEVDRILRDCEFLCRPRSPQDSPHARRQGDPVDFDGRPMRGRGE